MLLSLIPQLRMQGSALENNEHLLHEFQQCVTTPIRYNQVFQQRVSANNKEILHQKLK